MTPSSRKRFGQHFLHDQQVIARIVASLAPKKEEHLVEIGPGRGALTLPVLEKIGYLDAIELDRDLVPLLKTRSQNRGELIIHMADVLEFDFSVLKTDKRLLRVFGNLPYNISTPLIFHLLDFAPIIMDMLFMLQKEVALRLTAQADTEDYGRLSVMVQYHCDVELLFHVSREAFFPKPQVSSSIVCLVPYRDNPHPAKNYHHFAAIVKQAFGQRRKTLRNSLKDFISDDVWVRVPIHSDSRPEKLRVGDFVSISNAVSEKE